MSADELRTQIQQEDDAATKLTTLLQNEKRELSEAKARQALRRELEARQEPAFLYSHRPVGKVKKPTVKDSLCLFLDSKLRCTALGPPSSRTRPAAVRGAGNLAGSNDDACTSLAAARLSARISGRLQIQISQLRSQTSCASAS
tara:strand:- start:8 stop:439 length:432 start_codon:yes stop_codon:yes gene_type:complete